MIGPRRRRGRLARLVALPAVALVLAACTGVPSSSAPETIKPIPLGGGSESTALAPLPGAQPRDLVRAFLGASAADPGKDTSARAFLTVAARNRWTNTTATIIDGETVGTFKQGKPEVVVRGRVVGTLNAAGIYTPSLQNLGDGGAPVPFVYRIARVGGQYRIDKLRNGLVLTIDEFQQVYRQRNLYFFDLAEHFLVPDQRWSAFEGTQLAEWLIAQLASGPRAELQNAVNSDTLPTQANSRPFNVTIGTPTQIEIPGSAQLDKQARNQLAAQVGNTLRDVVPGDVFTITDGGTAVTIPVAGRPQFTASEFSQPASANPPPGDVYYLRDGRIAAENGRLLTGAVNRGDRLLTSIALTSGPGAALSVAAVSGTGAGARLLVGTQTAGLRPASLSGTLTRPAWAPGLQEVWIAKESKLYRVDVGITGKASRPAVISVPSVAGGGRIIALRLSPEGSRIAIVIATAGKAQQLFVGAVVRSAGQVRVDTLQPISPEGVVITDVAWLDSLKLFAIGYNASTQDAKVFETNVDGSFWSARNIGSLPDPPDSVTVTAGQLAWVSVGNTVWKQSGSDWESPAPTGQTTGTAPVYLE